MKPIFHQQNFFWTEMNWLIFLSPIFLGNGEAPEFRWDPGMKKILGPYGMEGNFFIKLLVNCAHSSSTRYGNRDICFPSQKKFGGELEQNPLEKYVENQFDILLCPENQFISNFIGSDDKHGMNTFMIICYCIIMSGRSGKLLFIYW